MEGSPAQWNAEGRQRRLRWSTRDEVPDAHDMIRIDLAARFLRPQVANTRPTSRPQLPEAWADHQIGDPRCLGRGRTSGNQREQGPEQSLPAGGGAARRGGEARKEWGRRRGDAAASNGLLWRWPGGAPVFGGVTLTRGSPWAVASGRAMWALAKGLLLALEA